MCTTYLLYKEREATYATANSVFMLSCAKDGCMGHLCFDCLQKACFSGTRSSQDPSTCPHCRRQVNSYSYAVFSALKTVDALQTKIQTSSTEVTRLTRICLQSYLQSCLHCSLQVLMSQPDNLESAIESIHVCDGINN